VQSVADGMGGYEDRMTDVRTKQLLFTIRHKGRSQEAEFLMYYPNGGLRVKAQFLDDSMDLTPTAVFVPSLHRPLSAYALLHGELTTYYADGNIRQQSFYQQGARVKSQCYDFKQRPVACNDNQLIIPAKLPADVYSQHPLDLQIGRGMVDRNGRPMIVKGTFILSSRGNLQRWKLSVPKGEISRETVGFIMQGTVVPINFAIVSKPSINTSMGSRSGAGNNELRSIAISAGMCFWPNPKREILPAMIDGQEVTTYFNLPIEFKLK